MITVCMATYNGEQHITRQLTSILVQLNDADQVIIVDDCSSDQTVTIVQSFCDNRINLYQNEQNIGVISSFERAISLADNDYILLSDQDDEWHPTKVGTMLTYLTGQEPQDLVIHDAIVKDGADNILAESWNSYNHNKVTRSAAQTILKNGYTGCMMGFNRRVKDAILPFPKDIVMHDQWIALVCIKKSLLIMPIKEELMDYIRHGGNVTGVTKLSTKKRMRDRLTVIKSYMKIEKSGD